MSKFSEIITGYHMYENEISYYGLAEVELPSITQITESMDGAGVAGKYDAIVRGHVEAMKMTVSMRNPTKDAFKMFTPVEHQFDLRANIQERDTVTGVHDNALKCVVRATPINLDIGKIANYSTGDTKAEFSVSYFAVYVDGAKEIEVDPFNYIFWVDGKDYLEDVRKNLGKA